MFKMKKIQAALAGVALVAALPLSVMAQGKEPVKVGLVSSKSGVFAEQGEEVMRAIKFAIEEANGKGGVDGRKVEFQEADDEGTPDAGRRVADRPQAAGRAGVALHLVRRSPVRRGQHAQLHRLLADRARAAGAGPAGAAGGRGRLTGGEVGLCRCRHCHG